MGTYGVYVRRVTLHTYKTGYDLSKVHIALYTFSEGGCTEAGLINVHCRPSGETDVAAVCRRANVPLASGHLCRHHVALYTFVFFSVCVAIMSLFVLVFLPETKNIPIEEMAERVWKQHWFWKRFMNDGGDSHVVSGEETPSTVSLFG